MLNAHLKKQPPYTTDLADDTKQIYSISFFSCPLNDTIRTNLLNTVQAVINVEVSTELLLFGSNNLRSIDQNLIIIDEVHLYFSTNLSDSSMIKATS